MTAIVLELKRGLGKLLFIPVLIAAILVTSHMSPPGVAIWPLTVSALANSVTLVGPLAAAGAAYAAGRAHRRRTHYLELLAARPSWSPAIAEATAITVWVAAAFASAIAYVLITAAASASWSGPDPWRVLAISLGLLLQVLLGFLTGRMVSWRLTPVLVALGMYALSLSGNTFRQGYRWALLLPTDLHLTDEFNRPNPLIAPSQCLWYAGVGLAAVAVWCYRQNHSRRMLSLIAVGLTLSIGGGGVIVGQHGQANRVELTLAWTCTAGSPEVCVHPALAGSSTALRRGVAPLAQRLAATPFALRRIEQRPRGLDSAPSPGAVSFAMDDSTESAMQGALQDIAVGALIRPDACYTEDYEFKPGYPYARLLSAWVLGRPDLASSDDSAFGRAAAWFNGLPLSSKQHFITTHAGAVRDCQLTSDDFQ